MEHNKYSSETVEFLRHASTDFAKVKLKYEKPENIVTAGDESPFDYSKAPKPFPVKLYPCKVYFTDDSSTDSSNASDSESEAIAGEESEIQTEKFKLPEIETETADQPFDYSNTPKPFPVKTYPTKVYFSDDSSTDSSYFSYSDSDETIMEEESKINKENSSEDGEKQLECPPNVAPAERIELDFNPEAETQAIQLAKFSTSELMSGVPTSSVLGSTITKKLNMERNVRQRQRWVIRIQSEQSKWRSRSPPMTRKNKIDGISRYLGILKEI
ncbi:hypothetical protein AgCh_019247 [Apium graveolens]